MNDEIVFYHNPMSRGRMVHWMLEEVGAPYRIELKRFDRGEHKKPEYLAVNPMGKLPAIKHRDQVITECGAIVTYLADAFPAAKLAPHLTDPTRGTYLRWMFFSQGCVESALIDHMLARPPASKASALGYGTYEDVMGALERALDPGPYLLGEHFSAADLYLGGQIGFGLMMKSVEPRPKFTQYAALVSQRPAFKRMTEQCEQLAAQMKD